MGEKVQIAKIGEQEKKLEQSIVNDLIEWDKEKEAVERMEIRIKDINRDEKDKIETEEENSFLEGESVLGERTREEEKKELQKEVSRLEESMKGIRNGLQK